MASPVVEQVVESATTTAGTSHTITAPTWTANQLLVIVLDKGSTAATISQSSGPTVTEILDENAANGLYAAYRFMQAGDSGNIVLTSSASTRTASGALRISGASRTVAPVIASATSTTGSSTTPDPPATTSPVATRDCLVIAFCGSAGEQADDETYVTNFPANYTGQVEKTCGVAGTNLGGMIGAASRAVSAMSAAENPGTFTVSENNSWRANTILIYPHLEVDAASAAYTVDAPTATNIVADRFIDAAPGTYTLTGFDAAVVAGRVVDAQPGSYSFTGQDAALIADRMIDAETAVFVVTGIDATLAYTPVSSETAFNAEPGSFTVTGTLASLVADRAIHAEPGSYALAGQVAGAIADRVIDAAPGAFALTGVEAAVIADRAIAALAGAYTVNGTDASLIVDRVIQTAPGEFLVTGVATTLDYSGAAAVIARLHLLTHVGE